MTNPTNVQDWQVSVTAIQPANFDIDALEAMSDRVDETDALFPTVSMNQGRLTLVLTVEQVNGPAAAIAVAERIAAEADFGDLVGVEAITYEEAARY